MEKKWETFAKIGAAAILGYIGNELEEMGGKQAIAGKMMNLTSAILLAWAAKESCEMVNEQKNDEWDHVA